MFVPAPGIRRRNPERTAGRGDRNRRACLAKGQVGEVGWKKNETGTASRDGSSWGPCLVLPYTLKISTYQPFDRSAAYPSVNPLRDKPVSLGIGRQLGRRTVPEDGSITDNIGLIGDFQCFPDIVVRDYGADALLLHL